MIVKSFTAPTVAEALKKIREELGGDAIILKTSVCPEGEIALTGHRIEVTACVDEKLARNPRIRKPKMKPVVQPAVDQPIATEPAIADIEEPDKDNSNHNNPTEPAIIEGSLDDIVGQYKSSAADSDDKENAVISIYRDLLDSDLDPAIADRIADRITEEMNATENAAGIAYELLRTELEEKTTTNIRIEKGIKVAFVGPSGSGKTTVLAKVAAQLCSKFKQKIKLVSVDQLKVSAYQEIGAYGDVLDLPVELINEMSREAKDDTILLIDTPSIGRDEDQLDDLITKLESIKPDIVFLVFSTCSRTTDLIDSSIVFNRFNPDYLIATHLDETDRWGGIVTMAECLQRPVAFVTDTPGGIGQLNSPEPSIIAQHLLKMEEWRTNE